MESLRNGDGQSCSDRETAYDPQAAEQLDAMLRELRTFTREPYGDALSMDLDFSQISALHDLLLSQSHHEVLDG